VDSRLTDLTRVNTTVHEAGVVDTETKRTHCAVHNQLRWRDILRDYFSVPRSVTVLLFVIVNEEQYRCKLE